MKETGKRGGNIAWKTLALVLAISAVTASCIRNVSAEIVAYTIDDTGSSVNITGGEKFNVSLSEGDGDYWYFTPYDSSILSIIDEWRWVAHPENLGSGSIHNWTIEGKHKGNTTISMTYGAPWNSETGTIMNNFTLFVNVTSNAPINTVWILLIEVTIIIVVPTVIIIRWFKGRKEA